MENADVLPRLYGTGNNVLKQNWDATYFSGISVNSAVATFTMHNHGIVNGRAIRVRGSAAGHNLNVVAPVTVVDNDHFTITYNNLFGLLPADGTYNSSTDPSLYVTVDPNFPAGSPFLSLRNLISSVPGAPAVTWPAIGFTFNPGNPGIRQWTGSTLGADAANNYVPQGPLPIYGHDGSVSQMLTVSDSTSGIATRPWQLDARAMLWSAGLNYNHYCISINFDPGCDHPNQLNWRPETTVAQLLGMVADGVRALRLYNFAGAPPVDYMNCCGWNSPGTINDIEMSSYVSPKAWSAMAHTNLLVKLREDTLLQPPGNKPYLGPFFKTDVHMSPSYGNQTMVICGSEMPYGAFPVPLNPISGGSTLLYTDDGYSTRVSTVAGNPSSVTKEWCPSPAFTNTFVSLPPSPTVQPIDNITFAPPAPLSFGASKFLIQVGYYPADMDSDLVIDCTSGCTIPIDHHNTEAYYRVIYADANSLPLSVGDPTKIPSQGLY
jgi:hypothetical protein